MKTRKPVNYLRSYRLRSGLSQVELANLLGGAVGGSRVVTNLGWRSHADQIGQTGARIAPELYIACGISGAIQHIVGCRAAKRTWGSLILRTT